MLTRIVVVDPNPPDRCNDTIVYHVPENSRAYHLLLELLQQRGIDYVEVTFPTKKRKQNEQAT